MMNILYIIDGLGNGGKERQLFEIARNLSKSPNIKIGIITFNKNQYYKNRIISFVDFFIEIDKKPNKICPFFKIWKHYRKFKPDIVHSWDSLSSMYSLLPSRFFGAKLIDGSIRDAGVEKGFNKLIKRFLLKRADLIISNSKAGLEYYSLSGKIVFNAIDLSRFHSRQNLNKCNIIMVANFSIYKDHQTFLKAALDLVFFDLVETVYLIGEGPNKEKYINYINSYPAEIANRIQFLGLVDNVEYYLSKCMFGVVSSSVEYSEGTSNSILEYMAAGLIAIGTNVGGMKEVIDHSSNGFLFDPEDSDRIIEIVRLVSNNEALFNKITTNARQTIQSKFSYHQNINELNSIYSKLCTKDLNHI